MISPYAPDIVLLKLHMAVDAYEFELKATELRIGFAEDYKYKIEVLQNYRNKFYSIEDAMKESEERQIKEHQERITSDKMNSVMDKINKALTSEEQKSSGVAFTVRQKMKRLNKE